MDPFQALCEIPELVEEHRKVTAELIETKRELEALESNGYVDWDWVCQYLDVERKAARIMLQDEKILVYGRKIKKFRRSDIVRFAKKHRVKVKDLAVWLLPNHGHGVTDLTLLQLG